MSRTTIGAIANRPHPTFPRMRGKGIPAFAGMTMTLLAACGSPVIRHQVLTPPPSSPRAEFFLETPEVQSREVGDEAWRRNKELSQAMSQALREAFHARGKILSASPTETIRSRIYLGDGETPAKVPGQRRPVAYIEVRLELLEPGSKNARYSTHTRTKLNATPFGWGQDDEAVIQNTLRRAAEDFVSRL